jgi:glucose-6-phosphate isomerase
MKSLQFTYPKALLNDITRMHLDTMIIPEIESINQALGLGYTTDYAALNLPTDKQIVPLIDSAVRKIKDMHPTMLIVIGIGGSNLGTLAVFQALYGTLYNISHEGIKFHCADTIDDDMLTVLLMLAERELKLNNTIIITIVTKSGTTAETLINGALFIQLLKKYQPDGAHNTIVVITDKDSPLWYSAYREGYHLLEIPKLVGGRYSVLSAVGLFPLALMGVDIKQLLAGALAMRTICVSKLLEQNSSALSALIIYNYYLQGITIHDTFIFSPDMAMLGAWYRQLVGESLGKSHDHTGKLVEVGITPTVSIGTTDLHSVVQLYLGGPRDKITTFVVLAQEHQHLMVPYDPILDPVSELGGKSVTYVKQAIFKAVTRAYEKEKRPFMTIILPDKSAYALGQFIMMKMCEIIYLGNLLGVNVFDQPAVELYKEETRKILSKDS